MLTLGLYTSFTLPMSTVYVGEENCHKWILKDLAFHNYLRFAIKVSVAKQDAGSFYKNQLKQQWQKFALKIQFLHH